MTKTLVSLRGLKFTSSLQQEYNNIVERSQGRVSNSVYCYTNRLQAAWRISPDYSQNTQLFLILCWHMALHNIIPPSPTWIMQVKNSWKLWLLVSEVAAQLHCNNYPNKPAGDSILLKVIVCLGMLVCHEYCRV